VVEEAKRIRIGPEFDPDSTMGPLLSREQLECVCGYTDAGFGEGAKALVGGKRYGDRRYFFEPTVLVDTQPTMQVVRDEIFGPVVTAMPFDDLEDLVRVANDTGYGLAAGNWTRDISKAHRIAEALRAGTVLTAHAAECPGGYSDTFQLDGEVTHPKTYTLPDLLLQSQNWTQVKDFFLTGSG
jgi:phenylacetaldehyde dehydrogenase